MKHWFFIINPLSGGKKAQKNWHKLEVALQELGIPFDYETTTSPGHAINLAKDAVQAGYRYIVAAGGDGTVNEVLQGLATSGIPLYELHLAVMPWGTGNDWAALHQIPQQPKAFAKLLKDPVFSKHDIGTANYGVSFTKQRFFLNFVGTGIDSFLLDKMGAASGKRWKYYLTLAECLKNYRSPIFTVTSDHSKTQGQSLMLLSCIGKFGGAGMKFAPNAEYNDGLFDLINIKDMPLRQRIMSLPYLLNGKLQQHKKVSYQQCTVIEFSCDSDLKFQCDGEVISELPVRIALQKKALNVLSNCRR